MELISKMMNKSAVETHDSKRSYFLDGRLLSLDALSDCPVLAAKERATTRATQAIDFPFI